ncbi:MAG: hypothetical protein EBQ82_00985 [Betaproteobacteria bacterium]|nr:hypothetical protein [Betaproteobacteria bacterium]NBY03988.1 hypothetical protein [Betaproteobacteria bacterium]
MRFLLVMLLILLGAWWWRQKKREKHTVRSTTPTTQATPMVHCHVCGVHLPQTEAIAANGIYFCSADHQHRAGP